MPSAPAPLRAAARLGEGRGPPRSGSLGVSPLLPGEPPLRRDPGAKEHSRSQRGALQPNAAACAPNAGARTGGCQAPRALESALGLARLSLTRAGAHFAQPGQGSVPEGRGLPTPGRVSLPPKVAYPSGQSDFP